MKQKGSDIATLVCRAIVRGDIPDAAIAWDRVEVLYSNTIIGSGESASWRSWRTVRLNGKKIAREGANDAGELSQVIPGELIPVGKLYRSQVYVRKPVNQQTNEKQS